MAIVSDSSAVFGLGNIGAEAGLPAMAGKAIFFKAFAVIDDVLLIVNADSSQVIIDTVRAAAPTFWRH